MVKPSSQRARHANQHQYPHHIRRKTAAIAVAACFTTSGIAIANPTAPTVVHGTVSMNQAGGILNITNSHNAIINWGSFSIGVNELTRFIQPSALSAVLNRVVGADPSVILGSLQSNGRVFLINPNGIMFGSGAQINVAGLVASTLNLSNDDFLNNRMRFTDGALAGSVVNQGNITGGSVYLIGNAVANKGLITSPNGEVVLAAGNSVELVSPGTPNLRVEVVAPANEAVNLGSISAEAGRVGIYAGLVKQGGTINADSAVSEGGRILLKSTKSTVLEAGSVTTARGTSGGQIVALSDLTDGKTEVAGKLDASAIASGTPGTGGFIETSAAKVKIADSAVINAAGSGGGRAGTWLIDPTDFFISNAPGSDLSATVLSSILGSYGSGTNVDYFSTSGATGSSGTVFVNDAVTWSSDATLRLIAVGNVEVNAAITNTGVPTAAGDRSVKLYAGWQGSFDGSSVPIVGIGPVTSNININAPISTGGEIHLVAYGNITQGGPGSLTAGGLLASSTIGSVNLANASATNTVGTIAGNAIGQFAFKNNGDLIIGSVGSVNGITAYGASPGLHVTVDVNVVGGALTVSQPVVAAVAVDGSEGQAGGNANISLSASNGLTVNANLLALAGGGGYGASSAAGDGGHATINLTNTGASASIAFGNGVNVEASGGWGGDGDRFGETDGGRGGDGTVTVTSAGGVSILSSTIQGLGGSGGWGSSGAGGRGGDGKVSIAANGGDLTMASYGGQVKGRAGWGGYFYEDGKGGRGGDGEVTLTASGGITINGNVSSYGGYGGSGISGGKGAGGDGGHAVTTITAGGALNVDIAYGGGIGAEGGEGGAGFANSSTPDGSGGRGGNATMNLTSTGLMTIANASSIVSNAVAVYGGAGGHVDGGEGFTGGNGGNASLVALSGGGITANRGIEVRGGQAYEGSGSSNFRGNGGAATIALTNNSAITGFTQTDFYDLRAEGGVGARGGGASVSITSAAGIEVRAVYADGGQGNSASSGLRRGGDASINLQNNSTLAPLTVLGSVVASGGSISGIGSGSGNGGDASIVVGSSGGIDVSGSVSAFAGDGETGGAGGAASIQLTSTSPSIGVTVDGGEIYAQAGNGAFGITAGGAGGNAMVSITSAAGLTVNSFVGADGGHAGNNSAGTRANGGGAAVTLNNTGAAPLIVNSEVAADAGDGRIGGDAAVSITSAGGIFLSSFSDVLAFGGDGYAGVVAGNGGTASVVLTNTNAASLIDLEFVASVRAVGGMMNRGAGGSGNGGDAVVILSSAGNISTFESSVQAVGGQVGGAGPSATDRGGSAGLTMFASGNIFIDGGEGMAAAGSGPSGGDAAVNLIAGGNIQIEGGEAFNNLYEFSSGLVPGNASVVASAGGSLILTDASIYSTGLSGLGGGNIFAESTSVWGGTGIQVDASGSLFVSNATLAGGGNANVTTGGNVFVENNGRIAGYPDVRLKVGGEIFIDTGGRIEAGLPTTIYLTFPMLESGGYTVNGIPGLVFDGLTGFFAGGSGAILGTNLLVTYGGGAALNVPTDTLIVAMNDSIKPPDAEKKKDIFEDESSLKKKKDAPVCR